VGDRADGAARLTADVPGEMAADVPESGTLGAEGAVEAPPLTVDE
jgi:hypothetical protein